MAERTPTYKLRYNGKGQVVPPQTTDIPYGLFTAYLGFVFPFVLLMPIGAIKLSPFFLQYTPSFYVFKMEGILSDSQIAELEFFMLVYFLMRASVFAAFKQKFISQFSASAPPPMELKEAWPKQFTWALKFGIAMVAISLNVGLIAQLTHSLSSKYAFFVLSILGIGLMFLTEGVMDFALYLTMQRKYWR